MKIDNEKLKKQIKKYKEEGPIAVENAKLKKEIAEMKEQLKE
jgi:hypothetical protein